MEGGNYISAPEPGFLTNALGSTASIAFQILKGGEEQIEERRYKLKNGVHMGFLMKVGYKLKVGVQMSAGSKFNIGGSNEGAIQIEERGIKGGEVKFESTIFNMYSTPI